MTFYIASYPIILIQCFTETTNTQTKFHFFVKSYAHNKSAYLHHVSRIPEVVPIEKWNKSHYQKQEMNYFLGLEKVILQA